MKKTLHVFFRIVFSRTMITVLLLLIQIGYLVSVFQFFRQYMTYILGGFSVLSIFLLVYIINKNEIPEMRMVWILPICFFPVFGALLYVFVMTNVGGWGLKKAVARGMQITRPYMQTSPEVQERMKGDFSIQQMSHYIYKISGCPAYGNTKVTYFPLGEDKFRDLLQELEKAEKFIFLEYFIIERGIMWDTILEILERKVKDGVDVRVMYDGMCSLLLLPYSYPEKLKALGIKAKAVSPIKPLLSTHQNNRDHRKILVIDGRVAYNGGVNLADEYINQKQVYGHWKDIAIKLEGDAVQGFTSLFLQMWNGSDSPEEVQGYLCIPQNSTQDAEKTKIDKTEIDNTKIENTEIEKTKIDKTEIGNTKIENTEIEKTKIDKTDIDKTEVEKTEIEKTEIEKTKIDKADIDKTRTGDDGYVIPYGDVPTDGEQLGETVYMDILNTAKQYVHIMTPYLILDYNMVTALCFAAKRGVDVKIILPHIPDKKVPFAIARSFYMELLEQGVKLYEYTPGFVHAKCFVSDDEKAVVGSINLDYRSLYHHFECATYMYRNPVIADIEKDYEQTLEKCQKITVEDYKKIPGISRAMGRVYRLLAPLM
ncbi:MAG: phospholipase D-like domain-containing protein [Lachnospiraceae bacterium]|nr:phospholipase D-like domain-containing protein [Lachnospiraceae bacterium]